MSRVQRDRASTQRCDWCGRTINRGARHVVDGLGRYHLRCHALLTHPDLCPCRLCDTDIH